ncbi:MAG TPA: YtxH domain-containing protein [Flavobacteriales bacterium]|nr:YtxH domain-containing protein [Flavobacteriales bacterium]
MENNGKLLGALLVGAAIGGALGILFAPDKGAETRKKLFSRTRELAEDAKERVKDGMQSYSKAKEKV